MAIRGWLPQTSLWEEDQEFFPLSTHPHKRACSSRVLVLPQLILISYWCTSLNWAVHALTPRLFQNTCALAFHPLVSNSRAPAFSRHHQTYPALVWHTHRRGQPASYLGIHRGWSLSPACTTHHELALRWEQGCMWRVWIFRSLSIL